MSFTLDYQGSEILQLEKQIEVQSAIVKANKVKNNYINNYV